MVLDHASNNTASWPLQFSYHPSSQGIAVHSFQVDKAAVHTKVDYCIINLFMDTP